MKIGLALITYNRLPYLKQSLKALQDNNFGGADLVLVIDDNSSDGTKEWLKEQSINAIIKKVNKGVANSKNVAIAYLLYEGCTHIFLMEDDILMKNPQTCYQYIDYAKSVCIQHLNFAHHGPANQTGAHIYEGMMCYPHCVGAFSYYTKECLEKVGLLDEKFVNAWEHVEHTYRIIKEYMHPPFWHFADHPNSRLFLQEIPGSIDGSSIRPRTDWQENIIVGQKYWIQKHGSWLPPRK